MRSDYNIHPSKKLNDLYQIKNYQGANPQQAEVLFVGRDPNWSSEIETMPIFEQIVEYLSDGINYWNKYKIHHPFLNENYNGDGKRYHKIFSKLDIDPIHSEKISFVELIGFPTTGMAKKNNKRFKEHLLSEMNRNHLIELDKTLKNKEKLVFIAWGLLNDFHLIYKKFSLFEKLANIDKTNLNIKDLNKIDNVYIHKHFSDSISNNTIEKISKAVKSELA